jgi:hypothetical protein
MRQRLAPRRVFGWLAIVIGLLAAPLSARADESVDPDTDCAGQGEQFCREDAASLRVSASPTRTSRSRQAFLSRGDGAVQPARAAGEPAPVAIGSSRSRHLSCTPSSTERAAAYWRRSSTIQSGESGCRDEGTTASPPGPVAGPTTWHAAIDFDDERFVAAHHSSSTGPRAPPPLG